MEQVIFNRDRKVTSIVIFNPELPWKCTFYKTFYITMNGFLICALIFGALYIFNLGVKYYKYYEQKEREEIGLMVEKIIDILQSNVTEDGTDNFVVINHVRDMILPITDRQKKERTWAKAVKFIELKESRIRPDVQVVRGEPFEVWRWIGSANLSMTGDRSDYNYRPGRRIVDVRYLISEVLKFPHKRLRFCNNADVEIKSEVREGFRSILLLYCKCCKKEHPICSEEPDSELMNVNLALVAGIVSLKLSLHHLDELCSSLRIPMISAKDYNIYLDEIFEIYNESMTESEKSTDTLFEKRVLRSSTPKSTVNDFSKKEAFLKSLEKSASEIENLSLATMDQRDNPLWYEERKKRLTASNFGRICKLLDSTDRKKIAHELLYSNFSGNIYTQYGSDNEVNAIKAFENISKQKVERCGLYIHTQYPFLAATPDGLVENGIIEIKCPYKARNHTPEEAINQKLIQFATYENGVFTLKRNDKYYFQVQGQLFVTGREACYFIVWTPHGLLFEKILKDKPHWDKMLPKLEEFYFKHMLPIILSNN